MLCDTLILYVYVHQTIVYSKNQLEKKTRQMQKKEKPKSISAQSKKHSKITAGYPLKFSNAEPHVQLAISWLGYLPFSDAP